MNALQRIFAVAGFFIAMTGPGAWAHSTGPLGKIEHDWHPDPAVKSVISLNFDFHAGANFVSWSPPARVEVRGGKKCIVGAYILFDIDESFAFDTDETIFVDLTFYRPETDGFILSYDQAVRPTAKQVRFGANADNSLWHRETVRLEQARFANRRYYGTDLAIGGIGSQLTHPEGSGEAVLCGLRLRREAPAPPPAPRQGTISLKIVDENGKPTAARVGLYRADGWAPLAGSDAVPVQRYTEYTRELPMVSLPRNWSGNGRYVFFVDGAYESRVPAGEYRLFVMKGPEYRIHNSAVTIESGARQSVNVALQRYDDLARRGWLSGDDHIHIGRSSPGKNDSILAFMKAEDIHVANLLQAANLSESYFKQYGFGEESVFGRDGYFLVSGQESPRTSHRGHTIGLNAKRFHWPAREYYFYDTSSDHIRADGGLWGYAHVALDAFNLHYGLALDVPRGKVDFLEMLQFGLMNTSYLYDFLNMGFKLLPSAGSDYPYIGFPGAERLYVHLDGPVSAKSWFRAMKTGRSFVSNWMSVDFTVNGDSRRVEYDIQSGEPVTVAAVIRANPDFDRIDRAELVGHGEVLHMVSGEEGAAELELNYSFAPPASMWLAIRAYGKGGALLHTAPVYVYVDGARNFSDCGKVAGLARKYRDLLLEFRDSTPRLDVEFERFAVEDLMQPGWEEAKPALDVAIAEARAIYDDLILTRSCSKETSLN